MSEIEIFTTPAFDRKCQKMLSAEMLEGLYDHLLLYPESGDIIKGTGGVRKLRWAAGNNKGKSGGVRVLYYYSNNRLILLITLYAKSEKENITDQEKNDLKRKIPLLLASYGDKGHGE